MTADIIGKLREELRQPIVSERQVVYILVELRKLIELNGDGARFKVLKFHCDWVAHPVLDRAEAQNIVWHFDKYQQVIEEMTTAKHGQKVTTDMNFMAKLGPTLTMTNFRNELSEYLRLQRLDTSNADDEGKWANFLRHYTSVIEDCPLKCVSQGLKYTDEVVLRAVNINPETAAAHGFQLVIEWSWRSKITGVESKNQQFY